MSKKALKKSGVLWRAMVLAFPLLLVGSQASPAASPKSSNGLKYGFFDMAHPAVGAKLGLGGITPHLSLVSDVDLAIKDKPILFVEASLRYMFPGQKLTRPYIGGGAGIAIRDHTTVPAHLVGGFKSTIDALPIFLELKIHLKDPGAASLWFGVAF